MAGIAPPFQVPKVHISSHFSPPRRAPGAETCINRAATVKFTLSQLLPTIGRRAGNIPASDPDTHPDLPRSRDQCRHKRKRQDPAVGPWRESAPTPIQLSRARRGVWKAPAHAHSPNAMQEAAGDPHAYLRVLGA